MSAAPIYCADGIGHLRCDVEKTVHHRVIRAGVLLADPGEERDVFIVHIYIGVPGERGRSMDARLPFHQRSVHLRAPRVSGCNQQQGPCIAA